MMTSCHLLRVSVQLGKNSLSDSGEVEANELMSEWGVRMLAPVLESEVGKKVKGSGAEGKAGDSVTAERPLRGKGSQHVY